MKNILIVLVFLFHASLYAEENSQRELRLIGKVLPVTSYKLSNKNNSVAIETSSNQTFASERQKYFVTNSENVKVDLKTQLIASASGTIRHEIVVKYIQELNQSSKPIVFNIQAN
jgi:microcystin-dependent protein